MLSVDHAFCEILYVCNFNRESLQSKEVVQTFNRTSLSDRAGPPGVWGIWGEWLFIFRELGEHW